MKKWIEIFGNTFEAVAFAEANCHDTALEILDTKTKQNKKASLNNFLENVGLQNVRFCYVTAKV